VKGKGLVALRAFAPGDRILVERTYSLEDVLARPLLVAEVNALMPAGGSLRDKISLNALSNGSVPLSESSQVAIRLSRANHACASNAMHAFEDNTRVKILVAERAIPPGEEIYIEYAGAFDPATPVQFYQLQRIMLKRKWNITCPGNCPCSDPALLALLERARELDASNARLLQAGQAAKALRSARALIALYDIMPVHRVTLQRAYFDAFQAAAAGGDRAVAATFARQGHTLALDLGPDSEPALRLAGFADDPTKYLAFGFCRGR
jgi:hypothetical protein